ncbi:MAG: glycoside hydrolase family 3 N-terminal domain-containing protein [Thermonemataceae bacterium]|nr:glycoside hydrolase family 3 N-terminal domain-containing protein [Thermonemataceae bacterium]
MIKFFSYFYSLFFPFFTSQEAKVEQIFKGLSEEEKVAQMIVTATGRLGKPKKEVVALIKNKRLGGVLLLNGSKNEFKQWVKEFNQLGKEHKAIPLLYSADAEPSLINQKIKGTKPVKATALIKDSADCVAVTESISKDLLDIGILHNFAPVCDISTQNEVIGKRSFGKDTLRVRSLAEIFINVSHQKGIIATAKHFPGHGYVKGDTHKKLVFIDGELKELSIYKYLISRDVPSIMVGHIAIKNNEKYDTKGLPATCSKLIVTDLLRKELGFEGIIITDAMNMGGVKDIPNASLEAAKAGCDMILMPENEEMLIQQILDLMEKDKAFQEQIYASVKRILRYKVALGLL